MLRHQAMKEARRASVEAKCTSLLNRVKTSRRFDVSISKRSERSTAARQIDQAIAAIREGQVAEEENDNTEEDSS